MLSSKLQYKKVVFWKVFERNFIIPFGFTFFFLTILLLLIPTVKADFINPQYLFPIGFFIGYISFLYWFKKLKRSHLNKSIFRFFSLLFVCSLFLLAFFVYTKTPIGSLLLILTMISITSALFIFYQASQEYMSSGVSVTDTRQPEAVSGQKKWLPLTVMVFSCLLFLTFGLNHLGKFMSVDEPKWVDTRVSQLFQALSEGDWENTYINDKPGLVPAFLSGPVNLFLDHETYKNNPANYETYLFFWRLPVLIFNFLLLFLIYFWLKKLLGQNTAVMAVGLIALNPVLIGISQIVNPDATLWSTATLSFLAFFIYLSTEQKKYLVYSGIFLGLSLLSKYFASFFYIIFFLVIYLEYIFQKGSKEYFFKRCLDIFYLFSISILTYSILFPATWFNPTLIIKGTIGAELLSNGAPYVLLALCLIFFEIIIFNGIFSKKIYLYKKLFTRILCTALTLIIAASFAGLLLNTLNNETFFDFNHYYSYEFERGAGAFMQTLIASTYTTLFTLTYPLLLGIMIACATPFYRKWYEKMEENKILFITLITIIIIYLSGSALGGYVAVTRYQIVLYPLIAILSAISFEVLFNKKWTAFLVIPLSLVSVIASSPFYYHYTNQLNIHEYLVTEAWGYGGYELAQVMNRLPNAEDISVWSDREGFNEFFIGTTYWRGSDSPFDPLTKVDYFMLTKGGERIFLQALEGYLTEGKRGTYNIISGETSFLSLYQRDAYQKVCIHDQPNNCVSLIKN